MFKLIVAGSRSFTDYPRMEKDLDRLLSVKVKDGEHIIIITGACPKGADALAARYAAARGLELREFHADWDRWKKLAGPIRNRRMAENGHALVAYWDGQSRGTADMIRQAEVFNLRIVIRRF